MPDVYSIHLAETDSTNRYLLDAYRAAADDAPLRKAEVVVVRADFQTAGRGQGSNRWASEQGKNLLCSILMQPRGVMAAQQYILSMAGALALFDVLKPLGEGFTLKWPNDVYWHDSKLSGTLIETTLKGSCIEACIFGIGLNVNQQHFPADVPNPVSLRHIVGVDTDVCHWLDSIVTAFRQRMDAVNSGAYAALRADYHAALYRRTGTHAYRDSQGIFRATMQGVADDGHLLLRDTEGTLRRYAVKEVEYIL
ncbi:MAG: biotin--[acetyl-CoA-carboxylase] ligase [Bacteroidaceae bacterium]|nr:biotin--[acetyl-CoA-carboxylase] ligase [Bacteroidaceae bacterium]